MTFIIPGLVTALGLVAITIAVIRVPVLREVTQTADVVPVDVIIPARDEAHTLPGLLADLSSQALSPLRVIVVDDGSSDGTPSVAAAHGATVMCAPARPDGWNPKVWAMHSGVSAVRSEPASRLVFLDADVRLAPGALAAVVAAAESAGGLVSVAPYHCRLDEHGAPAVLGSAESLSAPFNVTIAAGGGPGLARRARGAVGSCLTMSRADYVACGGHAATPNTIVDDLALAATVRRAGLPVTLLQSGPSEHRRGWSHGDRPLVTVRSYPTGFGAMARGWIKNLSAGLGMTPPASALAVAVWVTALLMPVALLVQQRWWIAAGLWVVVAGHTWWLTGRVGRFQPLVTSIGAPMLGVWFATVSALSVIVRLTRRTVTWKGRSLSPDGLER